MGLEPSILFDREGSGSLGKKENRWLHLFLFFFAPQGWSFGSTSLKINIEPENDGLEYDFPLPRVYSQVPCWSSGV